MAFFRNPYQLAQLFTNPRWHNPENEGKYLEGGYKPIEAFVEDIMQNLVEWDTNGKSAYYYMTKKYWYAFELDVNHKKVNHKKMVKMTRFTLGSWERMDDWANLHSVSNLGKEWLGKPEQMKKRVKLFEES